MGNSVNLTASPEEGSDNLDATVASTKRFSVTFSGDARQQLEFLSDKQGLSQVEVIRKAVATEAFLYKEVKKGARIVLVSPEGEHREVIFR